MWSKREIVLFFAGAQVFHTLSHILINLDGALPIRFFFITWTKQMNMAAIIINVIVTVALLWWAARLKQSPH